MKLEPQTYIHLLQEIVALLEKQPAEVAGGTLAHAEASYNELMIGREIKRLRKDCDLITKKSERDQFEREHLAATRAENVIKALYPIVVLLREEPGVEQCLKQILVGNPFYNDILKVFLTIRDQRLENAVDLMPGGAGGRAGQSVGASDVSHNYGDREQGSTTAPA